MGEDSALTSLGWVIVSAAICMVAARAVRLPPIVACLGAGILLGPATGILSPSDDLRLAGEIGVALMLFLVGLELSIEKIRDVGPVAIAAGIGQVVFTALGGLLLCLLLGFQFLDALFLAVALTFSSTVVVVKILTDKNEMDSLYGRIAVGIFLVQDIVVIFFMTILTGLIQSGESLTATAAGTSAWAAASSIAWGICKAFLAMGILLGAMLFAARFFLPPILRWLAPSPPTIFLWSLGWCFAVVTVAHSFGLSLELGAFFAGLSLAQSPHSRDLQHRIKPLMNFFIAVFFVTLGAGVSVGNAAREWLPILVLTLFVLIGNPFIFMAIIARMGYGERTSFYTSVTVAQISEFSFLFAAMGVQAGLASSRTMDITAIVGILTIVVSVYMILYNRELYTFCKKMGLLAPFRAPAEEDSAAIADPRDHILVVGMNSLGREIARRLSERGERVLALDTDPLKLENLPCETMVGSSEFLDVLLDAGLPNAKLLISALQIEEANELLAFRARQFGVPCAIHAVDESVAENLLDLDVAYLMLSKVDGIKLQNQLLRRQGILRA